MENGDNFQESKAKYDCLLFDLDDTLYPLSSGLSAHVTKNIQEYMLQKLGIQEDKVPELCVSLYKVYGTTMAGLKAIGYDFDYDDFHGFVHGRLPYNLLKPDPVLRGILLSLPFRKIVFSNSDEAHANRALHRLGLEDCFERIISFDTLNSSKSKNLNSPESKDGSECKQSSSGIFDFYEYISRPDANIVLPKTPVVCKPFQDSFEKVFKMADINPQRTLFFDDSVRNIQTGKTLGLHTVLVGTSLRPTGVDHALESIHNMKEAFPELWEADEKPEQVKYSRKSLAEKGGTDLEKVTAHSNFFVLATMNPGGDYGKKELSPALRNRFTEIWVPPVNDLDELHDIALKRISEFEVVGNLSRTYQERLSLIVKAMVNFLEWFNKLHTGRMLTVRDLISWVGFLKVTGESLGPEYALLHGVFLVLLDGLSLGTGISKKDAGELRERCFSFLLQKLKDTLQESVENSSEDAKKAFQLLLGKERHGRTRCY